MLSRKKLYTLQVTNQATGENEYPKHDPVPQSVMQVMWDDLMSSLAVPPVAPPRNEGEDFVLDVVGKELRIHAEYVTFH